MLLQQSEATAAQRRIPIYLVDATNGYTPETGLSAGFTIEVSKNGAAQGAGGGSISEIGEGQYYYEATAAELNTVGFIAISIRHASCRDFFAMHQIVPFDPYAVANLGLTDITSIKGKTDTLTFDGSNVLADVMAMNANVITAAAINADAITGAKIATGAIGSDEFAQAAADKIWSTSTRALTDKAGFTISGTITTLDGLDSALDTAHGAGSWATAVGFSTHAAVDIWSVGSRALTDKAGFTLSGTTQTFDALDTLLDSAHGAGSWLSATGFSTHAAVDIWSVVTRQLSGTISDFDELDTALDSAHGAGSWAAAVGFSTHTAADVWTAATRALSVPNDYKATGFSTHAAADIWTVGTRQLSGTINDFDALDTALDTAHGAGSWLTGGGGSGVSIQAIPSIPKNIDLANTKTVRIALYVIDQSDDLPTTGEITPGTIKIDRSADGGTSWSTIRNDVACSEHAGGIYYDEVFSSGNGYASADMIRITFKSQKVTIAANDYEIADATDGMVFITRMDSGLSGGGPSAGDIADAVWDEPIADHISSIQFGGKNQKVVPSETLSDYKATGFSTHAAADIWSVGTRALTDKAGFTISGTTQTFDALDTLLDAAHGAGSWASAVGFSTHAAADIWSVGTRALTTPNDYKADVSALATSAALSTHDGKLDTVDSNVDLILVDTDTTIPALIADLNDPTSLEIASDVWDELLTGAAHNIATSSGKRLRQLGEGVASTVNDPSASTTVFITNLTEIRDDFYNDQLVRFTSGNLDGHVRVISDYDGGTKSITTDETMVEAPNNGISFDIIPTHLHPRSEIADIVWDELMSGHVVAGSAGEQFRRLLSITMKHSVMDDYTWDGNNNQLTCIMYCYDTAANANTHNKSTGLIAQYSMDATFDGSLRPSLRRWIEDS